MLAQVIVNTCAFVEDAKRESIAAIVDAAHLKDDGALPTRGLFVTGCMAQRYAQELADELPEVDSIMGFESYADLPTQVLMLLESSGGAPVAQSVMVGSASPAFRAEDERFQLTPRHTAYLRVAEGCDHACSFCAIPGFRGSFRSKPYDAVLQEATKLVAGGVKVTRTRTLTLTLTRTRTRTRTLTRTLAPSYASEPCKR